MTPRDLRYITPPEIAVGTHFHVRHGTKTIPVFLPADGEASWLLLPSLSPYLSSGTVQPENTYSCILKVGGQVSESQKRISINIITTTTSIHVPKSVSTDLTIKSDLVLIKPIAGAKLVNVIKHLPHKVFLLWYHHWKGGQPRLKRHLPPMR